MLVRSRCTHVVRHPILAGAARIYNAHVLQLLYIWKRHCPHCLRIKDLMRGLPIKFKLYSLLKVTPELSLFLVIVSNIELATSCVLRLLQH